MQCALTQHKAECCSTMHKSICILYTYSVSRESKTGLARQKENLILMLKISLRNLTTLSSTHWKILSIQKGNSSKSTKRLQIRNSSYTEHTRSYILYLNAHPEKYGNFNFKSRQNNLNFEYLCKYRKKRKKCTLITANITHTQIHTCGPWRPLYTVWVFTLLEVEGF